MKILPWITVLGCFALVGCSDGYRDISNRPEIIDHGDGYYYGTGSVLTVMYPIKISRYASKHGLSLMGWRNKTNNDPSVLYADEKGVLPTGTLIRVERVLYYRHWENGDSIVPVGRILNGEYTEKRVDMETVRQRFFLKRVDDTSTNNADVHTPGFMWGAGLKPGVPRP